MSGPPFFELRTLASDSLIFDLRSHCWVLRLPCRLMLKWDMYGRKNVHIFLGCVSENSITKCNQIYREELPPVLLCNN